MGLYYAESRDENFNLVSPHIDENGEGFKFVVEGEVVETLQHENKGVRSSYAGRAVHNCVQCKLCSTVYTEWYAVVHSSLA